MGRMALPSAKKRPKYGSRLLLPGEPR